MIKSILILLFIFIMSCSSNDKDENLNNQSLYENNELSDYELYDLAKNYISNDELDNALEKLDMIQVIFPNSIYANKGMLLSGYIHFLKNDYEKTRVIAENYKKYYPGSKDVLYANYLEAMTYYVIIKKPKHSQKNTEDALEKFNFILNAYPNSKYEIDIITKIKIINDNLAIGKLETAKYYLEDGNYSGALIYLKEIFKNHSSSSSIEETLFYLTMIYKKINEIELAKNYAAILAYNFPESYWYSKSYNLLNDSDFIDKDKKWYEKFNPIKILINDKKDKFDDIDIQRME